LVFCNPGWVDFNYVQGKAIVKNGELMTVNVPDLVQRHNKAAAGLVRNY
jgi:hypothetical protein